MKWSDVSWAAVIAVALAILAVGAAFVGFLIGITTLNTIAIAAGLTSAAFAVLSTKD